MKRVFLTGFCRSGTLSIAQLLRKLEIESYHQWFDPPRGSMTSYDFHRPPAWAKDYINRKVSRINNSNIQFESSWGMAHYIYGLTREMPNAEFLIMFRDPCQCCNSLLNWGRNSHAQNINELALMYNMTFLSLALQSLIMERKPRWMDFEKYIIGKYTKTLFRIFKISNSETNQLIAENHLKKKVNSSGIYQKKDSPFFYDGRLLVDRLKSELEELE